MSSVNVAVAGAITLFALERDLARGKIRPSRLTHRDVDILVIDPDNPSEIGSLFRSVWAFGWRRVYLSDQHGVWFCQDRSTVLAGRAAARREVNPLVIASHDQLDDRKYSSTIVISDNRSATPLSRLVLPGRGPVLVVLGSDNAPPATSGNQTEVYVDHANRDARPCLRHSGSIALSMIARMLRRGGCG